jgi:hypothetical protein
VVPTDRAAEVSLIALFAGRRFGRAAGKAARALGYAGGSSVSQAIRGIKSGLGGLARILGKFEKILMAKN